MTGVTKNGTESSPQDLLGQGHPRPVVKSSDSTLFVKYSQEFEVPNQLSSESENDKITGRNNAGDQKEKRVLFAWGKAHASQGRPLSVD